MRLSNLKWRPWLLGLEGCGLVLSLARPSPTQPASEVPKVPKRDVGKTSYDQIAPVLVGKVSFAKMMADDKAAKAGIMARQKALLEERYDLTKRVHDKCKMTRGKPIPV